MAGFHRNEEVTVLQPDGLTIPQTKDEFYDGLGLALLRHDHQVTYSAPTPDYLIASAHRGDNITAGVRWCIANFAGMDVLATIARRAETSESNTPGMGLMSWASDLDGNVLGITDVFRNSIAYLNELFRHGCLQRDRRARLAFYQLVQQVYSDIEERRAKEQKVNLAIPETPDKFYAALGAEIVAAVKQPGISTTVVRIFLAAELQEPPRDLSLDCGKIWCMEHSAHMIALGGIAGRAAATNTGEVFGVLADGIEESPGMQTFLADCQPPYLQQVISRAQEGSFSECMSLLKVLTQIAEQLKQLSNEATGQE